MQAQPNGGADGSVCTVTLNPMQAGYVAQTLFGQVSGDLEGMAETVHTAEGFAAVDALMRKYRELLGQLACQHRRARGRERNGLLRLTPEIGLWLLDVKDESQADDAVQEAWGRLAGAKILATVQATR